MNIYRHEIGMNLLTTLYWTAGMLAGLLFFMFMFPAISKDAALIGQITSQFPPEVIRALGLSSLDLGTVLGYYGYIFLFIMLVGSVYSLKLGLSALSEEVRAKTTDFLLSKPVRRTLIISAKTLGIVSLLLLQNIIYVVLAYLITIYTTGQQFDVRVFMLINLSMLLVQLFFVTLGLLLSVVIKRLKNVLPIALGTVFAFWILQMLNQTLADPVLAYFTPFAYFDLVGIIASGGYHSKYLVCDGLLMILFTALAYYIYQRQDMPSV